VLIVDDNPHVVRLLARIVSASHPDVRVLKAFDGEKALEMARSESPDVILLDLIMPGMDGYDVLDQLAQSEATAQTQVIIISAHRIEEETALLQGEVQCIREGGFSLTEVLQVLQVLLPAITPLAAAAPGSVGVPPRVQSVRPAS